MPLLGNGTRLFMMACALGSMGTMSPGKAAPVAGFFGRTHPESAMALKFGEAGSHSLKSPCRMRRVGVWVLKMVVPSRYLAQLCDQKKNVLDLSVLYCPGM